MVTAGIDGRRAAGWGSAEQVGVACHQRFRLGAHRGRQMDGIVSFQTLTLSHVAHDPA
jgi:hypothetical protein